MKKLFSIATIICTMVLTACGSDATTTEYGTDNNVTESTVESTVEDTTEDVADVTEDSTKVTVVEDTTEVAEEVVEEPDNNAKPVDWTGYGEGQISITYIDGTIYEAHKSIDEPETVAVVLFNDKQNYECDSITMGTKSYGDLFTYDSNIRPEDFDKTLWSENSKPEWLYHHDIWNEKEIFAGVSYTEDLSLLKYYFVQTIDSDDAYTINGMEFYTVQDFIDVFGEPYGISYVYNGMDDATKGDEPRHYAYAYKLGDCQLDVIFEMSNSEPGNCTFREVMLVNHEYENMEAIYSITE